MFPGVEVLIGPQTGNKVNRTLLRQEPREQGIWFQPKKHDKTSIRRYRLNMPWMYYVLAHYEYANQISLEKVAMSAKPRTKLEEVSVACLPNMYQSMIPCADALISGAKKVELAKDFLTIYNKYWDSVFNIDMMPTSHPVWKELASRTGRTTAAKATIFNKWQSLSQDAVLALPWPDDRTIVI